MKGKSAGYGKNTDVDCYIKDHVKGLYLVHDGQKDLIEAFNKVLLERFKWDMTKVEAMYQKEKGLCGMYTNGSPKWFTVNSSG